MFYFPFCLHARTKPLRSRRNIGGQAQLNKRTGGCLAGVEKNRGERFPGTYVLMLTRPNPW